MFKKIGTIGGVGNSFSFLAIPKHNLVVVDNIKQKKNSELIFYKNFKICHQIQFDKIGTLAKFKDEHHLLFSVDFEKIYFVNYEDFTVRVQPLATQLVAKIDKSYFIAGNLLKRFGSQQETVLEKHIYVNPQFYNQLPTNCIYGYSSFIQPPAVDVDKSLIVMYSTETGKELWTYSTGTSMELQFIGNNERQLWCYSTKGQVYVLDIQTGKLLSIIGKPQANETLPQQAEHSLFSFRNCWLEKQKLVALSHTFYQEISTKTFKLKQIDLHSEFTKYDFTCGRSIFDKKYIYMYDSNWIGNHPQGKVAILDRKSLKIIWHWDMLKEIGTAPLHLEVIDNQLYVLDNGLTLHVFEWTK